MNLDSHIQLHSVTDVNLPHSSETMIKIYRLLGNDCKQVKPFIEKLSILSNSGMKEGVTIKGVPSDYFTTKSNINIIEGSLNTSQSNSILLSKSLADKLFAKNGTTITLFALKNNKMPSAENFPLIGKLTVTGIYESGIAKYDESFAFVSMSTASSLFALSPDEASGFEIQLNTLKSIDSLTTLLQNNMSFPYYAINIFELHAPIFTWIELQKKPIPIVLGLIILVAVFNIISVTLMIVLEKSKAIGVLRILGAKSGTIGNIFLTQGLYLATIGIIFGNILAYVLSMIQITFNVITLPSSIYFTSKVPLMLAPETFILVSVIAFVFSVSVSVLPAYIASKISPLTSIRFS